MRASRFLLDMSLAVVAVAAAGCDSRGDPGAATTPSASIDWTTVDAAMGRTGAPQPGDVHRYSFPRADMQITAAGVRIQPALALGSWAAFKAHGSGAMVMGDLVLAESEVAPVMSRLQEGGIEQTALHHHVMYESPRVMYMHIHAHGDPVKLAESIRAAIALTGTPPAPPAAAPSAAIFGIDTAGVARTLGRGGRVNGGVYQVSVPRAETIRENDFEIPPSMGLATVINFQPTGGGKATITGDFVMIASEVNPVIAALRENDIEVTALHNHLLAETPRLFFMHFWANDDALKLARGLRAALDRTNSR